MQEPNGILPYQYQNLACVHCGHRWTTRPTWAVKGEEYNRTPVHCPQCLSIRWNIPHVTLTCLQCAHSWVSLPRGARPPGNPKHCPQCNTVFWNRPRPEQLWTIVRDVPHVYDCAEWPHFRMTGPYHYGQVQYQGKLWTTHRLSMHLHKGPLAPEVLVCHHCDNPPCFNPLHLFIGDHQLNAQDCTDKGRNFIPAGEMSGRAILTEDIVRKLRREFSETGIREWRTRAALYGIGASTLRHAVIGVTWKNV